jgi:hypothetical protein
MSSDLRPDRSARARAIMRWILAGGIRDRNRRGRRMIAMLASANLVR